MSLNAVKGRHGLTPEDSINATGNALTDHPDYKHGQVVYLSMAGNDYRTLYGMNEWQSRGAEFLLNEGTDGNYSQEDIYGRSSSSVLGQMIQMKRGKKWGYRLPCSERIQSH